MENSKIKSKRKKSVRATQNIEKWNQHLFLIMKRRAAPKKRHEMKKEVEERIPHISSWEAIASLAPTIRTLYEYHIAVKTSSFTITATTVIVIIFSRRLRLPKKLGWHGVFSTFRCSSFIPFRSRFRYSSALLVFSFQFTSISI